MNPLLEIDMRLFALLAASLLFVSLTVAEDKKEVVKDEEAIIGTWKVEKFDTGTKDGPPAEVVEKLRFIFKKDGKMTTVQPDGSEKEMEYKLDPTAKPKALDSKKADSPVKGIYELDGDTLKICLNQGDDGTRPTEFKPDAKKFTFILTLKRVKEEKKDK
jgi:uncharacterized protein (TIGR03067 family)